MIRPAHLRYLSACLFLATVMGACRPTSIPLEQDEQYQKWLAFQKACHEPPFTGPTAKEPLPEGVSYISCGDGHQFVVAWEGAREKGLQPAMDFGHRHIAELHDSYNVMSMGYGLCCDSESAPPETRSYWCARVGVLACTTSLPALVRAISDMRSRDGEGSPPIGLSIHVEGIRNKGPRCLPEDKECGPTQSRHAKPYRPGAPRSVIDGYGKGECKHDGECNPIGCDHEACWAWTKGKYFGECYDPPDSDPGDVHCGCVQGKCELFHQ